MVIGLVVLVVCAAIALSTSGLWILGLFAGVILAVRGLMMRSDARAGLRDIDAAAGTLPSAKVRRAQVVP